MHISVLLKEAVSGLDIKSGNIIVDATVGGGGHLGEICRLYGKEIKIIGLDQDEDAIERVGDAMSEYDIILKLENFRNLDKVLQELRIEKVDRILADFGLSSYQLEVSGRGFSFLRDEPLLMSFKKKSGPNDLTAKEVLNTWQEVSLADVIYGYGEERYARRIAKAIVEARKVNSIETTFQLVEIIRQAVPKVYLKQKTHFATRTFQALRIAVNDELGAIGDFLNKAFDFLAPGGRLAVITFHSLEDRSVKHFFKDKEKEGLAKVITKKPIYPSEEEIKLNKRSRSAKLRILEKK